MTIKSDTNGTNQVVVDSNGTAITGALSVSNNITCSNATSTTISAKKLLTLQQDGDTYGTSYFRLANSSPVGAMIETTSTTTT